MAKKIQPIDQSKSALTYEVTKLPHANGRKVLVLPGAWYGNTIKMFAECGYTRAESVEDADLVCFIGGVDVNPELYNQTRIPQTQFPSPARDNFEIEVFNKCVELGKPMFGICRGAQFLHVMHKGELWQHVEGHSGNEHWIYDRDDDVYVLSNSYHHQMIALTTGVDLEVIAVCKEQTSRKFISSDLIIDLDKEGSNSEGEVEIEAGHYKATKCFFVQGHPEVGNPTYKSWVMNKLEDYMEEWECGLSEEAMAKWRKSAVM